MSVVDTVPIPNYGDKYDSPALFSAAEFRGVDAAVFDIGDLLTEEEWDSGVEPAVRD